MTRFARPVVVVIVACGVAFAGMGTSRATSVQEAAAGAPGPAEDEASPGVPDPAQQPPPAFPPPSSVKSYKLEEINSEGFILPIDRPYFTREELKRIMDAPGVKFVRRGPKGSPFYNSGFLMEPYDDRQFHVVDALDRAATPEERELAEEVRRRLEADRPENPGRANSFPKWVTIKTPEQPSIPLVHSGWIVQIRGVEEIPGGWRARVEVRPVVRTEFYERASTMTFHIELYACEDGKLTLEKEYPDPRRSDDPMKGIRATIRDR